MAEFYEIAKLLGIGPFLWLSGLLHGESGFFFYQVATNYGFITACLLVLISFIYILLIVWGIYCVWKKYG
jgi:uncharacterized membrane-anchored protein